jgi:hypothetical protein
MGCDSLRVQKAYEELLTADVLRVVVSSSAITTSKLCRSARDEELLLNSKGDQDTSH